jgi:dTDP-4-dehydrorhamnose reductase
MRSALMIWLIGNKGMLGTELSRLFEKQGLGCIGTDREVDITDRTALLAFAQGKQFSWIVNCAAYTAVDKAEDDVAFCRSLNTSGPANIAETAHEIGAQLLHISTDYVFNGQGKRPYLEDDPTDPTGVYGLTKRDGEGAVFARNEESYIIRTAWLYGRYGKNFVHTMLSLMRERDSVSVVNDQRGSPTWAFDLAGTIITLIQTADSGKSRENGKTIPRGIYHFSGEASSDAGITWFDFASAIYDRARARGLLTKPCAIKPCTSAEFPAKVKRPAYSVLDKTKIKAALGITIPDWKESLEEFLKSCEV